MGAALLMVQTPPGGGAQRLPYVEALAVIVDAHRHALPHAGVGHANLAGAGVMAYVGDALLHDAQDMQCAGSSYTSHRRAMPEPSSRGFRRKRSIASRSNRSASMGSIESIVSFRSSRQPLKICETLSQRLSRMSRMCTTGAKTPGSRMARPSKHALSKQETGNSISGLTTDGSGALSLPSIFGTMATGRAPSRGTWALQIDPCNAASFWVPPAPPCSLPAP